MFESADVFFGRGPSEIPQEMLQMRGFTRASRGEYKSGAKGFKIDRNCENREIQGQKA